MITSAPGPDGRPRCRWCLGDAEYLAYHDEEWGFPVTDDLRLFEKLCLESFQSGLSWRTILAKREGFRAAFAGFDFREVARFGARDVTRLLADAGIVRHRGKIEATVNNAKRALQLVAEQGSLAAYFWRHEPDRSAAPAALAAAGTAASTALSRDLKKRGWTYVGPTTVYAFMQAMGLVNDHAADCVTRQKVERALRTFERPRGELRDAGAAKDAVRHSR
jgi:DNA-3-methyladenine glycosylase I